MRLEERYNIQMFKNTFLFRVILCIRILKNVLKPSFLFLSLSLSLIVKHILLIFYTSIMLYWLCDWTVEPTQRYNVELTTYIHDRTDFSRLAIILDSVLARSVNLRLSSSFSLVTRHPSSSSASLHLAVTCFRNRYRWMIAPTLGKRSFSMVEQIAGLGQSR